MIRSLMQRALSPRDDRGRILAHCHVASWTRSAMYIVYRRCRGGGGVPAR